MKQRYEGSIAIIGMAGNMPNTASLDDFWRAILDGRSLIRQLDTEELLSKGVTPAQFETPQYIRVSSNMAEDPNLFDHDFFGYGRREASIIDPQQRVLLELAHEAFENAGYVPETLKDKVGVYLGTGYCNYLISNLSGEIDPDDQVAGLQILMGNDKDYAATRVSYKLNLRGPSIAVNSACSTSLVAVHQACRALQAFECDMALAGAAKISMPNGVGYFYQEGGISSRDGLCRPYDEEGSGPVFGNGAGVVLLKRIEDAVRDKDHIYALIRGSAINNDGASKVSFSAPSTDGQIEVIAEALADARVRALEVGYVEGHGTSTPLGDPIEVAALSELYLSEGVEAGCCYLGSVKANIGHLEAAAGIASLFKCVYAVRENIIPPLLNFKKQNKNIRFENTPFKINTEAVTWPNALSENRIAAISSFGIGGTNAHLILESYLPEPDANHAPVKGPFLVPLSAKTEIALTRLKERYTAALHDSNLPLDQLAFTASIGRQHYRYRAALLAYDKESLLDQLEHHKMSESTQNGGLTVLLLECDWEEALEGDASLIGSAVYRNLKVINALIAENAPALTERDADRQGIRSAQLKLAYAYWLATSGLKIDRLDTDEDSLAAACLATGAIDLKTAVEALLVRYGLVSTQTREKRSFELGKVGIYKLNPNGSTRCGQLLAPSCWLPQKQTRHILTAQLLDSYDLCVGGYTTKPVSANSLNDTLLQVLARAYSQGASLKWSEIYKDSGIQKISLPTYPFDKELCLVPPNARNQAVISPRLPKSISINDVIELVAKFSKHKATDITIHTEFQNDLMMESMMLAELNTFIGKQLGLTERIPLSIYFNGGSVGKLAEWLTQSQIGQGFQSGEQDNNEEEILTRIREFAQSSTFPAVQRIERKLVHKTNANNVLVARTKKITTDLFIAEIVQDLKHEYYYEHEQDHIPGLYLIEAARQAATAIVHQYFAVPFGCKFIMNDLSSSFESFAELTSPMFLSMHFSDLHYKGCVLERAKAKTTFIQNGRVIGFMQSRAVIFSPESYGAVRDVEAVIAG